MEIKKYLLWLGAWRAFAVVSIYDRKEWSTRMFLKAQNNEFAKPDELKWKLLFMRFLQYI